MSFTVPNATEVYFADLWKLDIIGATLGLYTTVTGGVGVSNSLAQVAAATSMGTGIINLGAAASDGTVAICTQTANVSMTYTGNTTQVINGYYVYAGSILLMLEAISPITLAVAGDVIRMTAFNVTWYQTV